jgi:hypothetical protein
VASTCVSLSAQVTPVRVDQREVGEYLAGWIAQTFRSYAHPGPDLQQRPLDLASQDTRARRVGVLGDVAVAGAGVTQAICVVRSPERCCCRSCSRVVGGCPLGDVRAVDGVAVVRHNQPHLPRHAVPAPIVTNHGRVQGRIALTEPPRTAEVPPPVT